MKKFMLVLLVIALILLVIGLIISAILFIPQIQWVIFLFFHPMVVSWIIALAISGLLKLVMPPTIGKKGKEVKNIFWPIPMALMAVFTVFWAPWALFTSFVPEWLIPSWKSVMMLVGVAIGVGLIVLVAGILIRGTSADEKRKEKATEVLVWALCLTIGLGVIHWLLWTLDAEFWGSVWATKSRFWAINLGVLFALLLLFLAKGADGKTHPVAKTFSQVIGVLVGIIVVVSLWDFMTYGRGWDYIAEKLRRNTPYPNTKVVTPSLYGSLFGPHQVPAEKAIRIICSCESTGRPDKEPVHYEADGKTLLKNKEGSLALGECQLMPPHWEEAKKLGLDLDKVEDYRAYVLNLYNRTGTQHWEFDEHKGGGSTCWGKALSQIAETRDSYEFTVLAPGSFGPETQTKIPEYYFFYWHASEDPFEAKNQNGATAKFFPKGVSEILPNNSSTLNFKSTTDKVAKIKMKFKRAT